MRLVATLFLASCIAVNAIQGTSPRRHFARISLPNAKPQLTYRDPRTHAVHFHDSMPDYGTAFEREFRDLKQLHDPQELDQSNPLAAFVPALLESDGFQGLSKMPMSVEDPQASDLGPLFDDMRKYFRSVAINRQGMTDLGKDFDLHRKSLGFEDSLHSKHGIRERSTESPTTSMGHRHTKHPKKHHKRHPKKDGRPHERCCKRKCCPCCCPCGCKNRPHKRIPTRPRIIPRENEWIDQSEPSSTADDAVKMQGEASLPYLASQSTKPVAQAFPEGPLHTEPLSPNEPKDPNEPSFEERLAAIWQAVVEFFREHQEVFAIVLGCAVGMFALVFLIVPLLAFLKRRYSGYELLEFNLTTGNNPPSPSSTGHAGSNEQSTQGKGGKKYAVRGSFTGRDEEQSSSSQRHAAQSPVGGPHVTDLMKLQAHNLPIDI